MNYPTTVTNPLLKKHQQVATQQTQGQSMNLPGKCQTSLPAQALLTNSLSLANSKIFES